MRGKIVRWIRGGAPDRRWLGLPVLVAAGIQLATGIPGPDYYSGARAEALGSGVSRMVFTVPPSWQDLTHVPLFAALAACLLWSLVPWLGKGGVAVAATLAGASLYAACNELSQAFIPMRNASTTDLLLDLAGVLLGTAAAALVMRR